MSQVNLGFALLILVSAVVVIMRYLLMRKTRGRLWRHFYEALQEREAFLRSFNTVAFNDFSAFDFRLGRFSHVSPLPKLVKGGWRYRIYLDSSDVEDVSTIAHEISECTIGRVIEGLLNLKKPLYLQRKEDDKFWVHGKKQRYLVEHVMATLGEADNLTPQKLRERLNKEDAEDWLS